MSNNINSRPPRTIAKATIIESADTLDVDTEVLKFKLLEVLRRETSHLLTESSEGRLDRDRSVALVNYIKLMNQLEEKEAEKLSELTDEELERAKREVK